MVRYEDSVKYVEKNVDGIRLALAGGFGMIGLWNRAPHPNAARLFVNWICSREGLSLYARTQSQVTVRADIKPDWAPPNTIPTPGADYLDTYEYEFTTSRAKEIRDAYAAMAH